MYLTLIDVIKWTDALGVGRGVGLQNICLDPLHANVIRH